ncbi:hypothetical protein E6H16_08170 [Candidatus Bathyarchaeota archaeon]|nr:MAG: hypothetical protein E6H16_08170 [Candidatus Bathyarchaeota archaeon]
MFYSVRTFGVLDSLGIIELFFGVLIGLIGLILGAVVGIIKRFKQRGEKADDGSATSAGSFSCQACSASLPQLRFISY